VNKSQLIFIWFANSEPHKFRRRLLGWYRRHARDLPWRASCDPYRVWLSEIMLQQTRVAAVLEHYREFLRRFPTVEKLAAARESSVLAAWSGLGYYRRARMLHAAAKLIVREHGGSFPSTTEGLRALPGIGRYTAAAIASIAFDEPVAVVDGNVERVLQRVSGKPLAGEQFWEAANHLLHKNRPGDFNQAMMELGAMACTPRSPSCLTCPVAELCATRGELAVTTKPARQNKREIHYSLDFRKKNFSEKDFRIPEPSNGNHRAGEVFLVQRARSASLMPGMWELPELEATNGQAIAWLTLRHSITTTDYTVRVWQPPTPSRVRGKWIPVQRLEQIALTGLARKILRKAEVL